MKNSFSLFKCKDYFTTLLVQDCGPRDWTADRAITYLDHLSRGKREMAARKLTNK